MLREGIQSDDLNKIRSGAGDKKSSGVDEENKLNGVYGTKYRINLDHPHFDGPRRLLPAGAVQ